jgi:hypothetical protein
MQQLCARVTEPPTGRRVGVENIALFIVNEDGVVNGLEQDLRPVAGVHK